MGNNKPWMNSTVQGLLDSILHSSAWDRTPILADALEENDFPDTEALNALRSGDTKLHGVWLLRVVDQTITFQDAIGSYDWLANYADLFNKSNSRYYDDDDDSRSTDSFDFNWIVEVCKDYLTNGDTVTLSYDTPRHAYPPMSLEMWKHYGVLFGDVPIDGHLSDTYWNGSMFSCAC